MGLQLRNNPMTNAVKDILCHTAVPQKSIRVASQYIIVPSSAINTASDGTTNSKQAHYATARMSERDTFEVRINQMSR